MLARDGRGARSLPALLLPAQLAARAVLLAGLDGRHRADPGRDGLRRAARLPARRVLARALVAVRARRRTRRARCARSRAAAWCSRPSPLARLLRPAPPPAPPRRARGARARGEAGRGLVPARSAHLALLGDKRLLFHESGAGFVMYGVQRRSWVAMGDPVGPPEVAARARLAVPRARRPARRARRLLRGRRRGPAGLPRPRACTLRKLGEEARVPLDRLLARGRRAQGPARTRRRACAREGCRFEVLAARRGRRRCSPTLRAVSDAWLRSKSTREKRFSLGFFDPAYLQRCPVARGAARRADRRLRERVGAATRGRSSRST